MESELLRHLVRNDGKIVSRKQILEEVWGLHEDTDTRAIDNFVVRLRRYIEDDPGQSAALAHGAGRGVPVSGEAGKEVRTDWSKVSTRGTVPPAASPGVE